MPKSIHNCHAFRAMPYDRVVRTIAKDQREDVRFSADSVPTMQMATEEYLVSLFKAARLAASHAGRVTLHPEDIILVKRIRGGF